MNHSFRALRLWLSVVVLSAGAAHGDHLADVYARVRPAVVAIHAGALGAATVTHGSGAVISADGLVLTVAHTVQAAEQIRIEFADGELYPADIIAAEPQADVALLRLRSPPDKIVTAPIGNSESIRVGDEVFAIGSPIGIGDYLSSGRVGSRHEPVELTPTLSLAEFFLTDALIGEGSSGAPMFNAHGEIVGIVSRTLTTPGSNRTVAFVVTSDTARHYLLERKSPWTGFVGAWLSGRMAAAFNSPQPRALLVEHVTANTLAEKLGLLGGNMTTRVEGRTFVIGGDIVLRIQGISLADEGGYLRAMTALCAPAPDEPIRFAVLRRGKVVELSAVYRRHCAE